LTRFLSGCNGRGSVPKSAAELENELISQVAAFTHDPLGFVLFAFDWGVGALVNFPDGPDPWQRDILSVIGDRLKAGMSATEAIQIAIASGHGIGKSALVAWLIEWAMATFEDCKGVVTANTENQLKTKTWSELAKWHRLCITGDWFKLTATALFAKDPKHEKTWRVDMQPWSEKNTEAFAGLHNLGKRILLVFDEASAIPDVIWEVSQGALTDSDTEIVWCCFGNPTQTTGRFRECFGKYRHRWVTRQIDSRTVKITNKVEIGKFLVDCGNDEDHDFFRVRVRGQFPSTSANALFGPDQCEASAAREFPLGSQDYAAVILGVDVARQGDDSSAIARRQGMYAWPIRVMKIPDTMLVAAQVALSVSEHNADACFVDESGGYGAGVVDALRQMHHSPIGIQFGGKPTDPRYFNKRSEMYFELSNWVKSGGKLPDDKLLHEELCAQTYTFQGDKFRLCDKDEVKDRIGRSPDRADALALTFAFPVQKQGGRPSGSRGDQYAPSPFGERGIW